MRYELALYDWNQTLLNYGPVAYICLTHVFATFAPGKPIPRIEAVRRESNNSDWGSLFYRYGIPESVTIIEMLDCWFEHYRSPIHTSMLSLNDGARELLDFCSGRHHERNSHGLERKYPQLSRKIWHPYIICGRRIQRSKWLDKRASHQKTSSAFPR